MQAAASAEIKTDRNRFRGFSDLIRFHITAAMTNGPDKKKQTISQIKRHHFSKRARALPPGSIASAEK